MTTTELEIQAETRVALRAYSVDLTPGDGRTVDVRIVPYGERIVHNDGLGGVPKGVAYTEEIVPGAFDHQLSAAHRVHVNVEHEEGIAGKVGHGLELASREDGFYGSFRMLPTPAGDTALELVRANALGGVSFEAVFRKSIRTVEGVVQRVKADLRNIALCRDPAYSRAVVLGLRTEDDDEPLMLDESVLPIPFDPELAERIRALGIDVPSRLTETGHLASDTSPEGDTSD